MYNVTLKHECILYIFTICAWIGPSLFVRISPNRETSGRTKNVEAIRAQIVKIYKNIQYTRQVTGPLIVRIYTVRIALLCTGVFLYIVSRASTV